MSSDYNTYICFMEVQGTLDAFRLMIDIKGVHNILGVTRGTVNNWRKGVHGVRDTNKPSLDLMEKLLEKFGASAVQEKIWNIEVPSKKSPA